MVSSDGDPEMLRWCQLVSSSRAVCRISGLVRDQNGIVGFQRLLAVNTDGSNPKLMGQANSVYDARLRQFDASVVDWLSGTDGNVLMSREYVPEEGKIGSNVVRKKSGLGVDQIDTSTLRAKSVVGARDGASAYMSDGRGVVRVMQMLEYGPGGMLSGTARYFYRKTGATDWTQLVSASTEDFQPVAVDAATDRLLALKKKDGRLALYGYSLNGTGAESLIAEHPKVDIDGVVTVGNSQRIIGYTYAEDKRKTVYTDPEYKGLAASLAKALPNLPLVEFQDVTADGKTLLIFAGSDSDPGRYYIFNRTTRALTEAVSARPQLKDRALASVKAVTVPGDGGVAIPAYLTVPAGKEAKNLPAVVLPHGGPSSRDEWGFDWLAQFLAARGYAVLQPQYRGSTGYGDNWLNTNGFRNWKTSIGDINASAKWLASQGIAANGKLAIVGWSYGGYAALQAAGVDPELYKAVVAIAPVTDLDQIKNDARNFTNARLVRDFIGSDPTASPIRYAAKIKAPVLLVHGDLDANVSVDQSKRMDAALKSASKPSELLTFRGLDHQLEDPAARTEMLTRIGGLLDRTIGQ